MKLLNTVGNYYRQIRTPTTIKPFRESNYPLPTLDNPISQVCTENQFFTDIYDDWCMEINHEPRLHRKQWEYIYILQALLDNDMLAIGRKGLGFGVGREPLPAVMAKKGCSLLVSDLDRDTAFENGWIQSNQYSTQLQDMNSLGICDPDLFEKRVAYQTIDMNRIPDSLKQGEFDFVWSACSLEHLGSIKQGVEFILNSLRCLRSEGIAVHTTEYNIVSNWDTLDHRPFVLFRKRDIRSLETRVNNEGYDMHFNPNYGTGIHDLNYIQPPFVPSPHLKVKLANYIFTSVGLIIKKQ
jgi:hypothetical protein